MATVHRTRPRRLSTAQACLELRDPAAVFVERRTRFALRPEFLGALAVSSALWVIIIAGVRWCISAL